MKNIQNIIKIAFTFPNSTEADSKAAGLATNVFPAAGREGKYIG
ncbi:MAG: hypothetical protein WAO52_04620 [Prolixibacteraceae bacterium]